MPAGYVTGTATVTSGSAVVTGTGTAWSIGVVYGGVFFRNGFGIPILSVDSATQLTLSNSAPAGMAGTGAYAIDIARAGATDAATANARLAQLVAQLQGLSPFFQSLTDDVDASAFRTSIGAAAPLGFTPVQQGGGVAQLLNKVLLGWSAGGFLKAQVDTTDLGRVWTDFEAAKSFSTAYIDQRLPSGLLLKGGIISTGSSDRTVTYPLAFPTAGIPVTIPYNNGAAAGSDAFFSYVSFPSSGSFTIRNRRATDGGGATCGNIWLAIGY